MTEHFTTSKFSTERVAMQARNARARELRKQGYEVECKKWDFTDLARCVDFTVEYWSKCPMVEGV